MTQQPLSERLKNIRGRCLDLPGGIKSVAGKMNRVENTLHNWFKGKTTPTVGDVELLKATLISLEEEAEKAKQEREERLNAALA